LGLEPRWSGLSSHLNHGPASFVFCLLSFVFCLLSFVFCLLSFVFCLYPPPF
jgi:hypothetical protein